MPFGSCSGGGVILPPQVYAVVSPVIAPVLARAGELLVFIDGHPLAVTDPTGATFRRWGALPSPDLAAALATLCAEGVIVALRPPPPVRLAVPA